MLKSIKVRYKNTMHYTLTLPASWDEYRAYKNKSITTLHGKVITWAGVDSEYITGNKLELEFLAKETTLKIKDIDKEFQAEAIKLEPEPTVHVELTRSEVAQYLLKDPYEEVILESLVKLGYIEKDANKGILQYSKEDNTIGILTEELLVQRVKELGYTCFLKTTTKKKRLLNAK